MDTPRKIYGDVTAPTPQNTPMAHAPISSGLARPAVPDILEDEEETKAEAREIASVLQSSAARSALTNVVQKRLQSLIGQSSGYIEGLPVEAKRSLAALHAVQSKYEDLQKEMKRELWEMEKKYFERVKPLYERRANIISGSAAPTLEEIEAGEKQAKEDDEDYEPLPKVEGKPESAPIPDFWPTVLRRHPGVQELLSIRDLDALKFLKDVQLSYLGGASGNEGRENRMGFKLSFFFSPNEYFENELLEKTYVYKPDIDWAGDYVYERAIGTEIRWKEDKDLTKEVQTKTQRSKKTNRTRMVKKTVDAESFFNFFSPPQPPSDEAIENEEIDDDELSALEGALAIDFQLGDDFKDRIIPRAADYFTGKALEWEEEDLEDWDDEDDEDEDEDEDEDGEDEQ
ncbi:NAP-domain-containing protein [Sanghuangporus baumii]|uniref:NAP-domain-containing protein n=1 Tax=Sanghuangporus baumii TaxID=108892 RepID=A0A9Q5HUD5_SANBA|nr:NAP-domain-containing protein [Sanghuangporus baumii]